MPLLHLLFTNTDVVVPPLFVSNHIILCYFRHPPPAAQSSSQIPHLCSALLFLSHDLIFLAQRNSEKLGYHAHIEFQFQHFIVDVTMVTLKFLHHFQSLII